jgi:hypothetical protein
MQSLVRIVVLLCLLGIVASLGSALYHLSRNSDADSGKLARDLTVRVALSLVMFLILMLAWYFGLIAPHTMQAAPHP